MTMTIGIPQGGVDPVAKVTGVEWSDRKLVRWTLGWITWTENIGTGVYTLPNERNSPVSSDLSDRGVEEVKTFFGGLRSITLSLALPASSRISCPRPSRKAFVKLHPHKNPNFHPLLPPLFHPPASLIIHQNLDSPTNEKLEAK